MKLKIICDKSKELVNLNKKLKKEFLKEKWVRECKVSYVSKTSNEADIYLIMSVKNVQSVTIIAINLFIINLILVKII